MAWKGKVMEFIPYCAEEAFQFFFYQIPKELFTNEYYKGKLSSDAIILYGLLLDRLSISIKNKWIDENGLIYLILTRKEAMEEEIKKMDDYSNSVRFLAKYNITTLTEVKNINLQL